MRQHEIIKKGVLAVTKTSLHNQMKKFSIKNLSKSDFKIKFSEKIAIPSSDKHENNSEYIEKAYAEKLYERLGSTTTFETLLRCEYGSSSLLIEDIIVGKIKLDGMSASTTICKHRFEDAQETHTHDDENTHD